jgi:SAM-dependent methyltransferase
MGKYHKYYDLLNLKKKDYRGEVMRIADVFADLSTAKLKRVLEIGCGTGNHTVHLCDIADEVVACDIDPEMVNLAVAKLEHLNAIVYPSVKDVPNCDFQLCVMMWHVLNYFPDIITVADVFSDVYRKLEPGGLIMFDMWNGVAVIRDLPRTSENTIIDGDLVVEHRLVGETDLLKQVTRITNSIRVQKAGEIIDQFEVQVDHFIWTVKTIAHLLCDFDNVRLVKTTDYRTPATADDWKIMVIAQK